jgi:serine/threonine-protein kinase
MDTDRNLLFGVLALQADLLDPARFAEACSAWATRKDTPLADLLVARGWLTPGDRADVEKLLDRKLKKHGGDARAGLAEVTTDPVRQSLAGVADPDVRQSLVGLTPPPRGHVLLATTDYVPPARERYTLSRLHATGGIGRVWLARDDRLGRDVALKELRPERAAQPAVWGRFLREASITGQLEHPGIVPIYEVSRRPDDQGPFYTMRFVRGRTLAEAVAGYHQQRGRGKAGPLELRELLTAFVGVCNAVAYAHSRGVLHRDLKPQNVVLGDYGEVIVLDWGLARLLGQPDGDADVHLRPVAVEADEGGTLQGQVLGTPAYMAPEQAEGRLDELSPATDVHGLGAILYEVLTGRAPFSGADTTAILRQVVHESPDPPQLVVAGTPAALAAVCLKALAKKPAERYPSAKELAGEVRHWLAGEPVTAYREPWTVRAGRWVKRHRVLVTGAAAAGLMALVGLAVVLGLQSRANRALRAANERETARFDLAMDAIKLFHGEVSEDVLLKEQQLDGLRTKLLRGAADFYGKLEELLQGQTDPRSRAALGKAYAELGDLIDQIGSKSEALAVHQKALAVRRELAGAPQADAETRADVARSLIAVALVQDALGDTTKALATYEEARDLAVGLMADGPSDQAPALLALSHDGIGALLAKTGRSAEALAAYKQAQALREQLADAHPGVTQFQSDLAESYKNIGLLLSSTGKPDEALAAHEQARALRQKLVDANPAVTAFQRHLAGSLTNIAYLLSTTGKPAEALAAHEQARAIRKKLADGNPAVTGFQNDLAASHSSIANLLSYTGKPAEALAALEQARAIRQKLADANPAVTQLQRDLAGNHYSIGNRLSQLGRPAEALAAHEQARTLRQKLADANPAVTQLQSDLAWSHNLIGNLTSQAGKPAEALASHEQARTIRKKLADANPANTQYQSDLAASQGNIAILLSQSGKPAEALAAYEQVRAIFQQLADAHPAVTQFRSDLAECHHQIGNVLSQTDKPAEALAAYEQARAIQEKLAEANPTVTEFQSALASSVAKLGSMQRRGGRPAEAVASFRRAVSIMERLPTLDPGEQYDLASYYALLAGVAAEAGSGLTAARGQDAADRAVDTLRRAIAAGYRNVARLRTDTALEPLRKREEFQKLMQELEAKDKNRGP